MSHPTVTLGGRRYVIVPLADATRAGLADDPDVRKREALGLRVRRARESAGLTQLALAGLVGSTQPSVAAVEGGREACSAERLDSWLAACRSTSKARKR